MTGPPTEKARWREQLSALRRYRPVDERRVARQANAAHLSAELRGARVVCGYLPLGSEPLEAELLEELTRAGIAVLVPVVTGAAPLDWVRYPAPLRPGPAGIAEPLGPRLGSGAVRTADVVLVPALAVADNGIRLGRGGGHYDRTLALLDLARLHPVRRDPGPPEPRPPDLDRPPPGPRTVAVLFDGELVPRLPSDRFDIPVDAVVTPGGGIRHIARTG